MSAELQAAFPFLTRAPERQNSRLLTELREFKQFGRETIETRLPSPDFPHVPVFINEFWTSKQRASHSLHEISYRACFKPELVRFFVERLTKRGDAVYDPFMGRGTTLLEAALLGRLPRGNDVNPVSAAFLEPRLIPPTLNEVRTRLDEIDLTAAVELREDLLTFYHPDTLREITNLKSYLLKRSSSATMDRADAWIRMIALNRLTGHSAGFFSVYTLPPNQAVSVDSQRKINERLNQAPEYRDVKAIILKKTRSLLKDLSPAQRKTLRVASENTQLSRGSADSSPFKDGSIDLVVTSPPFLDTVDYIGDNWLRLWFLGAEVSRDDLWQLGSIPAWEAAMTRTFADLRRVLRPGGHIAFEVGEVRNGKLPLELNVINAGHIAGLTPEFVLINSQKFTKTSNCWGVKNELKGTNTNRVVVFGRGADN